MNALNEKLFEDMDVDERIAEFIKEFELGKTYPATKFFDWHNKLTGSCEAGRRAFARDKNIDVDTYILTVDEFIDLTINSYGGEVIKALKEVWCI
jgi:hypothetical protein